MASSTATQPGCDYIDLTSGVDASEVVEVKPHVPPDPRAVLKIHTSEPQPGETAWCWACRLTGIGAEQPKDVTDDDMSRIVSEIGTLLVGGAARALVVGCVLKARREGLRRGEVGPWLDARPFGLSARTAQRYMKLAKLAGEEIRQIWRISDPAMSMAELEGRLLPSRAKKKAKDDASDADPDEKDNREAGNTGEANEVDTTEQAAEGEVANTETAGLVSSPDDVGDGEPGDGDAEGGKTTNAEPPPRDDDEHDGWSQVEELIDDDAVAVGTDGAAAAPSYASADDAGSGQSDENGFDAAWQVVLADVGGNRERVRNLVDELVAQVGLDCWVEMDERRDNLTDLASKLRGYFEQMAAEDPEGADGWLEGYSDDLSEALRRHTRYDE